jgi:NAD-dependent DNA ligase
LEKWKEKYNEYFDTHIISAKLDGVSGMFSNVDGNIKIYTRGDGIFGQDISHLKNYITFPKISNTYNNLFVRGEFIIPKEIFE